MASVLHGDAKKARFEVQEGIRLIEGIMIGRHYEDLPIIAQRICGICSVSHNLTAIKAIERAMGVKTSEETDKLRTLMEYAQIIHSHSLHLFFLSLADFLDIENDLQLFKKYPEQSQWAIELRSFGMEIIKVIGGRVIHPLTNEVGGFKKVPSIEEIANLIVTGEKALIVAKKFASFFADITLPEFLRETEYVCLEKKSEYAIYDGDVVSSKGMHIPVEKFEQNFQELHRPREIIKRVLADGKTSYMVGAIARVNMQSAKLSPEASRYLESLDVKLPDYNPFHNVIYQTVEVIHFIETSLRLLKELAHMDLGRAVTEEYIVKEGCGVAAIEASRGTLYYYVDLDANGYVKNTNIITPTAQFMMHLEDDIEAYIHRVIDLSAEEREKKLRAFIRAYDPCISCAVH